jgi:Ca-activated chloride channel family protein
LGRFRNAILIAAAGGFALAAAMMAQDQPTFKVDVRLVRMLATVKDPMGKLVGGLEMSDFRVFDNGVPQDIALFERNTAQPLSIALLVDTSRSTERERRFEIDSINKFVTRLTGEGNPGDTLALFSFNTDVTALTSFTRSRGAIRSGLGRLKSEGGTALYDAIYLAAGELRRREGRHVVLVVSDGGDTVSRLPFQKALEALHSADAVLYAVVTVPVRGEAGRNLRGENALITLSTWTGGQFFMPTPGADLDDAFARIIRDLRTQYMIGFYPKNLPQTKERFHKVTLQVDRDNHTVSSRNGYYSDDIVPASIQGGPKPLEAPPGVR